MIEKVYIVFGLSWLAYALFNVARKPLSVAKNRMQAEFEMTEFELGLVDAAFLASYTIGQFTIGPLADRLGSNYILGFGLIGSSIALYSIGASKSISYVILFSFLHGGSQSGAHASCIKILGCLLDRKNRGTIMGLWATSSPIGGIGGIILATVIQRSRSWRWTYFTPSPILAFLGGMCVYCLSVPQSSSISSSKVFAVNGDAPFPKLSMIAIARFPGVSSLCVGYFFLKYVRYVLLSWLPFHSTVQLDYNESAAGYLSTSFEIGGILGTVMIGWISDNFLNGRMTFASICMLILGAIFLVAYISIVQSSFFVSVILMGIIGFMILGVDSVIAGAICQDVGESSKHGGVSAVGTVTGIVNGCGSLGSISQGLTIPIISSLFGWNAVFYALVVCLVLSAIALVPAMVIERRNKPPLSAT